MMFLPGVTPDRAALLWSLPWIAIPTIIALRAMRSRSLGEYSADAPTDAPQVSVIIPARDEAHNIERCVRSVLTATWPNLEVIVVDDHSRDGTGDIVRAIAGEDARVRVLQNPDLPDGWFGKQWACWNGAHAARGRILCFADADTTHSSDLVARSVNAMHARGAGLLSIAGTQELGTFWERVVQPQIFGALWSRYGSSEEISNAKRPINKIANGQCIFITREGYERAGGHEGVKHNVADDLMLAQHACARGVTVHLLVGMEQLSTRMYTSLREIIRGWMKNIYAGGIEAMPGGVVGRALYPLLLVTPMLTTLAPTVALLASVFVPHPASLLLWAVVSWLAFWLFWVAVYRLLKLPLWYSLLYPLGAAVVLYIALGSIAKGRRIEWKGRQYAG